MMQNISKEQRFQILKNEFSYDIMYQASMDLTYHYSLLYGREYFLRNFR